MSNLEALQKLLHSVREQAVDDDGDSDAGKQRDKGTFFENLTQLFLQNDKAYASQYKEVYTYADWAAKQNIATQDTGIDLVAETHDGDYCAIQCKFYAADYKLQKQDIDSFMNASGKKPFTQRLVVDSTMGEWGHNAEVAIQNQQIPVSRLTIAEMADSSIDWSQYQKETNTVKVFDGVKSLRPHQQQALDKVAKHFQSQERGKLIMACGTGKTFTSLKIAEQQAGKGQRVLYLVPSLALMQQTIKEWFADSATEIYGISVCSDSSIGKKTGKKMSQKDEDMADISLADLVIPATTDAKKVADKVNKAPKDKMTVVFSTYQSIQVVSAAQNQYNMADFAIAICDEAHRTTGVTLAGADESHFVKVHDNQIIHSSKRLYMTATPRIYGDTVKDKAEEVAAELASMDDEQLYGGVIHTVSFNEAVENDLLCDYKVIVLALAEGSVDKAFQRLFTNDDYELNLEDTTKLVGCYKGLSKIGLKSDEITDPTPMRRAVAFCRSIEKSKSIAKSFPIISEDYGKQVADNKLAPLAVEMQHVDGTHSAAARKESLEWLKENSDPKDGDREGDKESNKKTCRILSNVRCLSEGVDVPALDAVMFLHARDSMVEVVQAVGRVMRRAQGKKMGYVILPIGIPAGTEPDQALDKNKNYKVVWQVLNALRCHDERLEGTINRASLGGDISDKIEIVAMVNALPSKTEAQSPKNDIGSGGSDTGDNDPNVAGGELQTNKTQEFDFQDKVHQAIIAKLVKRCGTRDYWEDWAKDIAQIAQTHIERINTILEQGDAQIEDKISETFANFVAELQQDLNPSVSRADAVEMLAQHIITKPVFEALFTNHDFSARNPVSVAMDKVLQVIQRPSLEAETDALQKFYASVQRRVQGTKAVAERQQLIVQLYDKFFKGAFPKTTAQLGIVYTPTEVVDFIIHSIEDILQDEFDTTLGAKGVNIVDPFTGTGTFITRLLQSGLITPEQLPYKYQSEIHANEMVLLAYYIASINIEQVYHEIMQANNLGTQYQAFTGICLSDTFQMQASQDESPLFLFDNRERRKTQKGLDIRVIMGNPPYSTGQKAANDNAQNVAYPELDSRIEKSYVKYSKASNKNSLYDSYIRAIRWGSDRLGDNGVMGYVSGSGYIEKTAMDGIRKCLAEEYSNLYVFNLRGDIRKNMLSKGKAKEGQNVFGSGSMTGIAITLFVKNPKAQAHGNIYYHDIGNDLSTKQKLAIIHSFKSINGIAKQTQPYTSTDMVGWQRIKPDKYNDWLNQRDKSFYEHMPMADKATKDKADIKAIFANYSNGLKTNRDAWCYNSSKTKLAANIQNTIAFYNSEVDRYQASDKAKDVQDFISNDATQISLSSSLLPKASNGVKAEYNPSGFVQSEYRPFSKQWGYYDRMMNERVYQLPQIFPMATDLPNRCICVTGIGSRSGFGFFISDKLPDLGLLEACQCFPLKLYEENTKLLPKLPQGAKSHLVRDGITDYAQQHFSYAETHNEGVPSKEDIFYYIYGVLHHPDYTAKWEDNLTKALPHIPKVKTYPAFMGFATAGRKLADLHIHYDNVAPYHVHFAEGHHTLLNFSDEHYRVKKMKFGKKGKEDDKSTIIYNEHITLKNIPLAGYDYKVNARSAIEWVMDRQVVKTDKASQIVNDANDFARETMANPKYPLELLQKVITVSMESQAIIKCLPKLEF